MDVSLVFEKSYRIINKYNQKNKTARTYGTEHILYPSEVHVIEIIGDHKTLNTTRIAELLGITKGAVSQTTNKLLKKELITKTPSEEGGNEVFISLTDEGMNVYLGHRKLHNQMIENINESLSKMTAEQIEGINSFFDILDRSLEEL